MLTNKTQYITSDGQLYDDLHLAHQYAKKHNVTVTVAHVRPAGKDTHSLLLDVADRLGLPTAYKDDLLIHDLAAINRHPEGSPFLWAICHNGTHIDFDGTLMRYVWRNMPYPEMKFFRFDGKDLEELGQEEIALLKRGRSISIP